MSIHCNTIFVYVIGQLDTKMMDQVEAWHHPPPSTLRVNFVLMRQTRNLSLILNLACLLRGKNF